MKTKAIITAILLTAALTIQAEENAQSSEAKYGINMSQSHTNSGHGSNVSFSTNVRKANKSLSVGAIYSETESKISGADIKYKVYLGTPNEFVYKNRKVNTFFQYNCMYQKKTVENTFGSASSNLKSAGAEVITNESEISTIEHYVGFGVQVKLMNRMHLEGSMGAGGYFGSVKNTEMDMTDLPKSNGGYSLSFKIGVGYAFK